MSEHPFLMFLKEGKIDFNKEEGIIRLFNENGVLIPVRTFNKLLILLEEELPKSVAKSILKELGRFQVSQALNRYVKIFNIQKLEKQRIIEFVFDNILPAIGFGKYELKKENEKIHIIAKYTPFSYEFVLEYPMRKEKIDFFLCGGIEKVFEAIFGEPMVCEEVKCYAKGDDCCEFIVKPKEEVKEEK